MYACIKHLYAVYLISRITRGNKSFWWAGGYDPKSLLADPLKYPVSIWTMPEMAFIGAPPPPPSELGSAAKLLECSTTTLLVLCKCLDPLRGLLTRASRAALTRLDTAERRSRRGAARSAASRPDTAVPASRQGLASKHGGCLDTAEPDADARRFRSQGA